MKEKLISMRETRRIGCLSKTHQYRLINAGKFPKPVRLGPQKRAVVESEFEAWLAARLQEREADND